MDMWFGLWGGWVILGLDMRFFPHGCGRIAPHLRERAEIEWLKQMPEHEIDTSDIPPLHHFLMNFAAEECGLDNGCIGWGI
jgi:hypothetical protein